MMPFSRLREKESNLRKFKVIYDDALLPLAGEGARRADEGIYQ